MIFVKSEAIVVVAGDYCVLRFHAIWSGRSVPAVLKNLLPPSSEQEVIFPKPDKIVQFSLYKPCS
jgi:hypothetical protein